MLYAGFEKQGYATEAAMAMREWAFESRRLDRLVSYIDPENLPSRAVAERLGGVLDPAAARQDPEDLVFRYRP
jgi:RimJ/RimL family protein N-acetyltransferase